VTDDVIPYFLKTEVHIIHLKVVTILQLKVTLIKSMFYKWRELKSVLADLNVAGAIITGSVQETEGPISGILRDR
jgi:hypothetical protein